MQLLVILYVVNFVRTLLIIAVIYFGIRLVTRYILPLLVDKGIKNMQQKMQDQQRQTRNTGRPEGEVTIEKDKTGSQSGPKDKGDYVDFEEVD